jgi:hypothetical protein
MSQRLIDLGPHCCKAVVDHDGEAALICGLPVVKNTKGGFGPWCQGHRDRFVIVRRLGVKSTIAESFEYNPAVVKAKSKQGARRPHGAECST